MEKHNTHIVLDSLPSERHEYKGDENGNIKIDSNDDAPYHSYIQKKAKTPIRQILIDNNNMIKKDFDEKMGYSEVEPKKQNTTIEKKRLTKVRKSFKIKKSESDDKKEKEKKIDNEKEDNKEDEEENLIKINKKENKKIKKEQIIKKEKNKKKKETE